MLRKHIAAILAVLMLAGACIGCAKPAVSAPESASEPVPEAEKVTITVAGGWTDCRALDVVASAFTAKYPNCTIVYEYLQDYYASLEKRLTGDSPVDIFFTTNIQPENSLVPYALDLNSREDFDLSNTFDGLINNFTFREENPSSPKLYAIPLGSEMRGMYVNVTLLKSLGLEVPTDQASLLSACSVLKENGYIPFHGNPGGFAQTLIYPWVCNLIANADDPQAAYARVDSKEAGVSEMFREPCQFLYSLVENYYYDYKTAQTEYNLFNDAADEAYARDFFNIQEKDGAYVKADDVGMVAFLPSPMSLQRTMDKTKDDYHSEIEYTFVTAPVGVDGGFAYMSPAHGIAIYKNSANLDWSVKFLDFLFQPENNKLFAAAFNIIPNTKEAFNYTAALFDLPDGHVSQLGQVTFSYDFYSAVTSVFTDISKANNPKYMQDDGSGKLSVYPLEHFMEELETSIQEK